MQGQCQVSDGNIRRAESCCKEPDASALQRSCTSANAKPRPGCPALTRHSFDALSNARRRRRCTNGCNVAAESNEGSLEVDDTSTECRTLDDRMKFPNACNIFVETKHAAVSPCASVLSNERSGFRQELASLMRKEEPAGQGPSEN